MRYLRFLLISGIVLTLALVAAAQQSTERVVGGDDAAVREFLLHYLGSYNDETFVTINSLPEDLPVQMPFPDDTNLLGSITRFQQPTATEQRFVEIYTNLTTSPEAIAAFYETALTAPAWKQTEQQINTPGGFSPYSSIYGVYCYNNGEASVGISASGSNTDELVRMNMTIYLPGDAYQCGDNVNPQFQDPTMLIPVLTPVDGVTIRTDIGGPTLYGPQMGAIGARLETVLPLSELFPAYNTQFQAAGWQPVSDEINTLSAVSNWTFTHDGETWFGTFTVYRTGNAYNGIISVEAQTTGN